MSRQYAKSGKRLKMFFLDVKRVHFNSPVRRLIYVKLPPEDHTEGMCGRLLKSMYGCRDASANWEDEYSTTLVNAGMIQGIGCPSVFREDNKDIRMMVHGDDFIGVADEDSAEWTVKILKDKYEIKVRAIRPKREGCKRGQDPE